ncbi:MAG: sensor histidine kinase [Candidatus Binatia bacterium]
MVDSSQFRHFGGGQKGVFLLLRYLFIAAAAYLIIFERQTAPLSAAHGVMIAAALGSNVALSFVASDVVFSWYVEAPVLIADTLWVSWALHSTGTTGQEFFLLYFFVLCLAALGESLAMVLLGSTVVSVANLYFSAGPRLWTSPNLLRVVFFYAVALFYGHVISQIKQERQRATKGLAWARELEAKVAERTQQLRQLYDQAQAANRLKSEFLATMSHELRTPLVAILGYTDLILEEEFGALSHEQAGALQRVHKRSQELLELINSTLEVGRLEAGALSIALTTVDAKAFLEMVQVETESLGEKPNVGLEWDVPPSLPVLHTDPAKLKIVLKNLIGNAVKFTEEGRVAVRAQPYAHGVEISVSDTGIGIAPDVFPVIFEPFRQGDGSSVRRYGGVGLGLYIVRRLVDLLQGTVTVESRLGQGSTFRIWLPISAGADAHAESHKAHAAFRTA